MGFKKFKIEIGTYFPPPSFGNFSQMFMFSLIMTPLIRQHFNHRKIILHRLSGNFQTLYPPHLVKDQTISSFPYEGFPNTECPMKKLTDFIWFVTGKMKMKYISTNIESYAFRLSRWKI